MSRPLRFCLPLLAAVLTLGAASGFPGKPLAAEQLLVPVWRATRSQATPAVALGGDLARGQVLPVQSVQGLSPAKQADLARFLQQAKEAQAAGDTRVLAASLNNVGIVYLSSGQPKQAVEWFNRALPAYQASGDLPALAKCLGNLGGSLYDLGQYDQALTQYQKALDLQQRLRDPKGIATALSDLGHVYSSLGQQKKALEYYERMLPLLDGSDPHLLATALLNIGDATLQQGQARQATPLLTRCVEVARAAGDRGLLMGALDTLGQAYALQGQHDRAVDYQKRSLEMRLQTRDAREIARALNNLGATCKAAGRYPEAADYLTRALTLKKAFATADELAATYGNLALIYYDMGKLEPAAAAFAGAIQNNEIATAQVREASKVAEKQGWMGSGMYARYAALLLRQNKPEEALAMLERGRGQGLARQAAQNRADFSRVLSSADSGRLQAALRGLGE